MATTAIAASTTCSPKRELFARTPAENLVCATCWKHYIALDHESAIRTCCADTDATFVMAKGGGADVGATKRGKGIASCPLRAPGCRLKLRPRLQSKQHPRDECSGRSRFASRGPTARQLLVLRIPDQRPMTRKRAAAHGGKAIQSGFFNDACGSD